MQALTVSVEPVQDGVPQPVPFGKLQVPLPSQLLLSHGPALQTLCGSVPGPAGRQSPLAQVSQPPQLAEVQQVLLPPPLSTQLPEAHWFGAVQLLPLVFLTRHAPPEQ